MKKIIGLDIGGTKCSVVLGKITSEIEIIDKITFLTKDYEFTINKLFDSVEIILDKNNISDINCIGVSCGGPLDSNRGIILCPPNLSGWINVPLVKMLEDKFKVPTFIQNDAKACALVEWKLGAGKGTENMMFLTMGTGMGSGIILNNRLITGSNCMAGEVGHIRIEDEGPIGFGKAGSFEGFCSGGGIKRLAQKMSLDSLKNNSPYQFAKTTKEIEELDTKKIAEYAKNGDEDAINIFKIVGEKLGKGLSYFIDILNPEIIVIGSIFLRCEELLRPSMEEVLKRECISYSLESCKIVPAKTGEQIGDFASIIVAMEGMNYSFDTTDKPKVIEHYNSLFKRYPILNSSKNEIFEAYKLIKNSYLNNGKLLCCGNGGSASDCEHIVGELMKSFMLERKINIKNNCLNNDDYNYLKNNLQSPLPAISLTQHTSLSTAFQNDVAPDLIFAQQVFGYGSENDILLAISTSGNSKNIIKAVQTAKLKNIKTIALTGSNKSILKEICDVTIMADASSTPSIQELHLPIYHTLCAMLEAQFFSK